MGVIVEAMGIHPTTHTLKTDRSAGRTGTEVSWCDYGLLEWGINETQRRGKAE